METIKLDGFGPFYLPGVQSVLAEGGSGMVTLILRTLASDGRSLVSVQVQLAAKAADNLLQKLPMAVAAAYRPAEGTDPDR